VATRSPTFPAFGGDLLKGSDRPWVVSEGVGKAGVVHVEKVPQIVLPMRPTALHGTQVERYCERSEVAIADYDELAVRRQGPGVGDPEFDPMLGSRVGVFGAHGVFKLIPIIWMENDVRNRHPKSFARRGGWFHRIWLRASREWVSSSRRTGAPGGNGGLGRAGLCQNRLMVDDEIRWQILRGQLHGKTSEQISVRIGLDRHRVQEIIDAGFADLTDKQDEVSQSIERFVAESSRVIPRLDSTTHVFENLVASVFVPTLKAAGFKKTRHIWHRPGRDVWPVVDIQKGNANGDLLTFTSNWAIHVPGWARLRGSSERETVNTYSGPLGGRIGEFGSNPSDYWWAAGLGELRRIRPRTPCDDVPSEIAELLSLKLLPFLDRFDSLSSLVDYIESHDVNGPVIPGWHLGHHGGPGHEVAMQLRTLQ
jgi:hypothetical protein